MRCGPEMRPDVIANSRAGVVVGADAPFFAGGGIFSGGAFMESSLPGLPRASLDELTLVRGDPRQFGVKILGADEPGGGPLGKVSVLADRQVLAAEWIEA